MHKKLNEMRPNYIFTSNVKRGSEQMNTSLFNNEKTTNITQGNQYRESTKRSSLGVFNDSKHSVRIGQDQGYAISSTEQNLKASFNATSPRFNYFKEETLLAEVPGPGTYEKLKT